MLTPALVLSKNRNPQKMLTFRCKKLLAIKKAINGECVVRAGSIFFLPAAGVPSIKLWPSWQPPGFNFCHLLSSLPTSYLRAGAGPGGEDLPRVQRLGLNHLESCSQQFWRSQRVKRGYNRALAMLKFAETRAGHSAQYALLLNHSSDSFLQAAPECRACGALLPMAFSKPVQPV